MKVILDCDNTMGVRKSDVDDGLTFAYLYAHPDVEVQGITCTFANNNEHVVYYNTLQMMEDLEITDVPVLKGGRTPGAYDSEAVNFLVDTVNKNPGEITVIAIGSMCNIAGAYTKDPEFFEKIHRLIVMGGILEPLYLNGVLCNELNFTVDSESAAKVIYNAPYKILLVVSDGNSTSSLIQLQLVNLLKPLHFSYDVVSSRQFMSSMAEKYALVVGDIPRENTFSHVIPVSAILTESQRNRILQWSIRFSNMNNDDDLTRLYDIIQMHCTIHDEEILKVKLFSFLNENSGTESSQIPSLLQIMKVNDLFLFSEKMDIDQILFVMSRDFVIKKIVKALYPVNILHLLQTMGAYGEISKGVLLLHAEDVSYCNGLGIRIGNLEYPLRLSGNPHEIHTIILLSTPDKLKHLRILKNLSQLFRNADFLNRLEKGMFSTKEQMYKKIAQILSTEE